MRAEDRYLATRRRGHLGDSFSPTVAQCPRWRRLPGRCFARPAGLPSRRLWCVEHTRPEGFYLTLALRHFWCAALPLPPLSGLPASFACLACPACLPFLPSLPSLSVLPSLPALSCLPCLPASLACLVCLACLASLASPGWSLCAREERPGPCVQLALAATRPPSFVAPGACPCMRPPRPAARTPMDLLIPPGWALLAFRRAPLGARRHLRACSEDFPLAGTPWCPLQPPSLLGGFSLGGHPLVPVATSEPARRIFPWRAPLGARCHLRACSGDFSA